MNSRNTSDNRRRIRNPDAERRWRTTGRRKLSKDIYWGMLILSITVILLAVIISFYDPHEEEHDPLNISVFNRSNSNIEYNLTVNNSKDETIFQINDSLERGGADYYQDLTKKRGKYNVTIRLDDNRTYSKEVKVGSPITGIFIIIYNDNILVEQIV